MDQIKPGLFSKQVAADFRRSEFDSKNEQILHAGLRPDFVFIGDSITHAWELGAYFRRTGRMLVNRGIGGDIPYYVEKRFAADVAQLSPRCAVVLCGINETWGLDSLTGPDALAAECDAMIGRIMEPMRAIVQAAADAHIALALCSILPTYGTGEGAEARKRLVKKANERLRALPGILYVDYHSALCDADGLTLRRALSPDGCHPNAEGYALMAGVLRGALKATDTPID